MSGFADVDSEYFFVDMEVFTFAVLPLLAIFPSGSAESTLEHVQVLFRHGDRTPTNSFPTDKYQEDFWPQGFGQLTQVGMRQHYELGQFLRKKYVDDMALLSANYSRYQVNITSTDVDRTLMSAAADLAGLFPPQGNEIWNTDIPWQPIPVHTMPASEDYHLSFSAECPKYDELEEESLKDEDYLAISKQYSKFLEDLNRNSGFNGSVTVHDIFMVADPLNVEKLKKLDLPEWTNKPHFWETLNFLDTYAMAQLYNSTAKSRLRGGPLLGLMIQNMRDSINSSLPPEHKVKFHMYSAHDVTITSFLYALKLFNDIMPPYASAVGVELWKNTDKKDQSPEYSVRIWYRNDTKVDPYILVLSKCKSDCPFDTFVELTKDRALADADIKEACGLLVTQNFWIPTLVGIGLGVMTFMFVVVYLIAVNRKFKAGHKLLENNVEDPW